MCKNKNVKTKTLDEAVDHLTRFRSKDIDSLVLTDVKCPKFSAKEIRLNLGALTIILSFASILATVLLLLILLN